MCNDIVGTSKLLFFTEMYVVDGAYAVALKHTDAFLLHSSTDWIQRC